MAIAIRERARPIAREMIDGFDENELLLFGLGALGFLGLSAVWSQDVRPTVQGSVSPAAPTLIDDTVRRVLGSPAALGILVHQGAGEDQPLGWISGLSLAIVAAWMAMSAGVGLYLSQLASYGSIYGALAGVVVLMGYLHASTVVFLGAIQLDALLRELNAEAA